MSPNTATTRTAEAVARRFFRSGSDPESLKRDIRRWALGAVWAAVLVPAIFYLKFGTVGLLGWGLTIFLIAYCLLSATGLYFLVRPEYHTPVTFRNDWMDRLGAFWLVACAFGPLIGWALTATVPLTGNSWHVVYWGRLGLCIGLPLLTALPLLRYVRGQGAPVMLAILLGVTALPVWSGWATWRDLQEGPIVRATNKTYTGNRIGTELYLVHTERVLAK